MTIQKGIWWVDTDCEAPPEPAWHTALTGDPDAWQRDKLQLWRWQWKWHLFSVDLSCCDENAWQGYYVYCQTAGEVIRARRWVRTPYFFARLGPEDVTFWAANVGRHHYQPLPIKHLGGGGSAKRLTMEAFKRPESRKFLCNWDQAVSL